MENFDIARFAAIAAIRGNADAWIATFRQVPYDRRRMVAMADDAGRPQWARALEIGWLK